MPVERGLDITFGKEGPVQQVSFVFEDSEWKDLSNFATFAKELGESKLIVDGGARVSVNVKWDAESGFTVSADNPDWEEVAAVLHRARPFLLNDEPTNFRRIANLIGRRGGRVIQRVIEPLKRRFSGALTEETAQIRIDGLVLNSERALHEYLNGFEYHRDSERRDRLDKLVEIFTRDGVRGFVLLILIDKLEAIVALYRLILVLQGTETELNLVA